MDFFKRFLYIDETNRQSSDECSHALDKVRSHFVRTTKKTNACGAVSLTSWFLYTIQRPRREGKATSVNGVARDAASTLITDSTKAGHWSWSIYMLMWMTKKSSKWKYRFFILLIHHYLPHSSSSSLSSSASPFSSSHRQYHERIILSYAFFIIHGGTCDRKHFSTSVWKSFIDIDR